MNGHELSVNFEQFYSPDLPILLFTYPTSFTLDIFSYFRYLDIIPTCGSVLYAPLFDCINCNFVLAYRVNKIV